MTSSDFEDISPSNSIFDSFYPDYPAQADTETKTMPPLTCNCGHKFLEKESFNRHKMACSERDAKAAVKDILRESDNKNEQSRLAAGQGSGPVDYFARSGLPPNNSRSNDPRSPRVAQPLPDLRRDKLPQNFKADTIQQPAPTSIPQQPSYSDFLGTNFSRQQADPQPQLGYIPAYDPHLNLHGQHSGYQSYGPGVESPPLNSGYPLPLPYISNPQPNIPDAQYPSPPSRSASVLSITSDTLKRVGTRVGDFLSGRGRGRPKKRTLSPPDSPEEAKTKQRKVNNAKQQKCRQRKADNQEALEAEVQRLRAILRTLGGCGEGEPIEGRNWF